MWKDTAAGRREQGDTGSTSSVLSHETAELLKQRKEENQLTSLDRRTVELVEVLVENTENTAPLLVVGGEVLLLLIKDVVDERVGVLEVLVTLDAVAGASSIRGSGHLGDGSPHVGRDSTAAASHFV